VFGAKVLALAGASFSCSAGTREMGDAVLRAL
jgi:hypothetical protein